MREQEALNRIWHTATGHSLTPSQAVRLTSAGISPDQLSAMVSHPAFPVFQHEMADEPGLMVPVAELVKLRDEMWKRAQDTLGTHEVYRSACVVYAKALDSLIRQAVPCGEERLMEVLLAEQFRILPMNTTKTRGMRSTS